MPESSSEMKLVEGVDFYREGAFVVFTAAYHLRRGSCCGNGCKWCPYEPSHEAGATQLTTDDEFWSAAEALRGEQAQP